MSRYFKPRSLTWWNGVIPATMGVVIATEPLHGMTAVVQSVDTMVGGVPPAVLISGGLGLIGLRAAPGMSE